MHEAAIAAPLLRLVLDEVRKGEMTSGPLQVTRIRIKAGLLTALEPVTLEGCFSLLAEGGPAEHARISVEPLPLRGQCPDCAAPVSTTTRVFSCPVCGGSDVAWTGGNELYIDGLQVKVEPYA